MTRIEKLHEVHQTLASIATQIADEAHQKPSAKLAAVLGASAGLLWAATGAVKQVLDAFEALAGSPT